MTSAKRSLYLICYDIACDRRRYHVHRLLQGYRIGGQKSLFECWMTPAELRHVQDELTATIDLQTDKVHWFQLDPRQKVQCAGVARPPQVTAFMVV